MSRLVGGVGTQNGPAPNLHVVDENWEGYLRHGGARNPSLTPGSQPGVLVPGRRVPTTSGCEKQWGFQPSGWDRRCRETQDILLKSLHTDSLTGTHPGLWQRDSDSGGVRGIWGTDVCPRGVAWRTVGIFTCVESFCCAVGMWVPSCLC